MALEILMASPENIKKLVVIAPAGGSKLIPAVLAKTGQRVIALFSFTYVIAHATFLELNTVPLYLGWASDDPITFSWDTDAWKSYQPIRTFVMTNILIGGHVVDAKYEKSIEAFLKAN